MEAETVVAPHFDDAVFSVAHVLLRTRATIVTVCAGAPAPGVVSDWDAECGYTEGVAAAADRAGEDLKANQISGATSVHLGLTDAAYRTRFPVRATALDLARAMPLEGPLWIPVGIGSHPDHVGSREAVLSLPRVADRLRFYADCPDACAFGWDARDTDRVENHRWQPHLDRLSIAYGPMLPHTVYLTDEQMAQKLEMVTAHASQMRGMLPNFPDLLNPHGPLRREVYWTSALVTANRPK
ncbi:PIG-L deacetylase family protein [Dactylosporangium sp. NPDC051541]|uniref:PIG-L deacetylase family protein n=1 Tax=Dactylosporangium sp. NPDC051541 TaxID=3363977 RepID=UPI00379CA88A